MRDVARKTVDRASSPIAQDTAQACEKLIDEDFILLYISHKNSAYIKYFYL